MLPMKRAGVNRAPTVVKPRIGPFNFHQASRRKYSTRYRSELGWTFAHHHCIGFYSVVVDGLSCGTSECPGHFDTRRRHSLHVPLSGETGGAWTPERKTAANLGGAVTSPEHPHAAILSSLEKTLSLRSFIVAEDTRPVPDFHVTKSTSV